MNRLLRSLYLCSVLALALTSSSASPAVVQVERFGFFERSFQSTGIYENPYTDLESEAELTSPNGSRGTIPLFWDGGNTWKLRLSPHLPGKWSFHVRSRDGGLNGQAGSFHCVDSTRRGSIEPMQEFPHHFSFQNGQPMWFMGDTAWALFTDNPQEKHNGPAAKNYLKTRAAQGFNVVHSMALSEAGWGNSGGNPFHSLGSQRINPAYWQDVDQRIAYANQQGLVVGLALAWGDKRKKEPFAWRRFPDLDSRKRYARYIGARYGAYQVYFLVSGEWHGEVRTRPSTESDVKKEFIEIGESLDSSDPHDRMIGIHPMTQHGSVREFNDAEWMSFGDYQQNYRDLHARALISRKFGKPVVNSEYGYHLRDRDGDGTPDKDNSTNLKSIRDASWDIVMAGGYLVTGFGTTYFGGHRDPGPFNVKASQNKKWEQQIGLIKKLFTSLEWWKLEPRDEWLESQTPRSPDGKHLGRLAPPTTTYWLLADQDRHYLIYVRGLRTELNVKLGQETRGYYQARLFNPRTGQLELQGEPQNLAGIFQWAPPDDQDWVLLLSRGNASDSPGLRIP